MLTCLPILSQQDQKPANPSNAYANGVHANHPALQQLTWKTSRKARTFLGLIFRAQRGARWQQDLGSEDEAITQSKDQRTETPELLRNMAETLK